MGSVLIYAAVHAKSRRGLLNTERAIWNLHVLNLASTKFKKEKKFRVAENTASAQEAPAQTMSSSHVILDFKRFPSFPLLI